MRQQGLLVVEDGTEVPTGRGRAHDAAARSRIRRCRARGTLPVFIARCRGTFAANATAT